MLVHPVQRTIIVDDLAPLAESWRVHLEATNLSPKTVSTYMLAVAQLRDFLEMSGCQLVHRQSPGSILNPF
jgi:hypothetical protein